MCSRDGYLSILCYLVILDDFLGFPGVSSFLCFPGVSTYLCIQGVSTVLDYPGVSSYLCIPEHSMHTVIPRLMEAQRGSGSPQSQQLWFPGPPRAPASGVSPGRSLLVLDSGGSLGVASRQDFKIIQH